MKSTIVVDIIVHVRIILFSVISMAISVALFECIRIEHERKSRIRSFTTHFRKGDGQETIIDERKRLFRLQRPGNYKNIIIVCVIASGRRRFGREVTHTPLEIPIHSIQLRDSDGDHRVNTKQNTQSHLSLVILRAVKIKTAIEVSVEWKRTLDICPLDRILCVFVCRKSRKLLMHCIEMGIRLPPLPLSLCDFPLKVTQKLRQQDVCVLSVVYLILADAKRMWLRFRDGQFFPFFSASAVCTHTQSHTRISYKTNTTVIRIE